MRLRGFVDDVRELVVLEIGSLHPFIANAPPRSFLELGGPFRNQDRHGRDFLFPAVFPRGIKHFGIGLECWLSGIRFPHVESDGKFAFHVVERVGRDEKRLLEFSGETFAKVFKIWYLWPGTCISHN